MTKVTPPEEIFSRFFRAFHEGNLDEARALWAEGALFHMTGSYENAGDYSVDEILSILSDWYKSYPDYQAEFKDMRSYDGQVVVAHIHSTGGAAPGLAGGLVIFRVVEERVREAWLIDTVNAGQQPF
jgi:hypothetical protein